jgi:hypothetical protein
METQKNHGKKDDIRKDSTSKSSTVSHKSGADSASKKSDSSRNKMDSDLEKEPNTGKNGIDKNKR